jgi:hypothetical protein
VSHLQRWRAMTGTIEIAPMPLFLCLRQRLNKLSSGNVKEFLDNLVADRIWTTLTEHPSNMVLQLNGRKSRCDLLAQKLCYSGPGPANPVVSRSEREQGIFSRPLPSVVRDRRVTLRNDPQRDSSFPPNAARLPGSGGIACHALT